VRGGRAGTSLEIDWQNMAKNHHFLKGANFLKKGQNVKSAKGKKKKKSREEQAKIYRKLLKSGEVKNKAELARKFGVSRAWITMVLS